MPYSIAQLIDNFNLPKCNRLLCHAAFTFDSIVLQIHLSPFNLRNNGI